ncbi:hypothetical protein RB594_004072 [Gaeumannomyces avenae]
MCSIANRPALPHIITGKMAIPAHCLRQIVESWDREPAFGSVYSRFNICFGGLDHPDPRLRVPKFYEFNADTLTSLLEGASIQWYWFEQTGHGPDQFNAIEESLVEAWRRNLAETEKALGHRPKVVHFASMGDCSGEDEVNTKVLAATCAAAGYAVKKTWFDLIAMGSDGRFYDIDGNGKSWRGVLRQHGKRWQKGRSDGQVRRRDHLVRGAVQNALEQQGRLRHPLKPF